MSLTRYEFEVMTYLEREGSGIYTIRDMADTLCISAGQIEKALAKAVEEKWISLEEENINLTISVTEKGLEALEPYRVTRAVILAAGFGSRMMPATADKPKPMVTVNGVRIIDTLLDALVGVGITDITIVRGYKKEKFDELLEKYPFLTLVDNDDYDKANNITSALLVLDKIDGCYICESDLYVRDPKVILKYQYASNFLGSYSMESDDWCFKMKDGYIDEYQKGNTFCYTYYGISFWTKEDSARLRKDFKESYETEKDGKELYWDFVPLLVKHDEYKVEVRPCSKKAIMEIDQFEELMQLDPSYKAMAGK